MRLIENWRDEVKRLWSLRLALVLFAINGLYIALPAWFGILPPWVISLLAMGFALAIGVARLIKQPGAEV